MYTVFCCLDNSTFGVLGVLRITYACRIHSLQKQLRVKGLIMGLGPLHNSMHARRTPWHCVNYTSVILYLNQRKSSSMKLIATPWRMAAIGDSPDAPAMDVCLDAGKTQRSSASVKKIIEVSVLACAIIIVWCLFALPTVFYAISVATRQQQVRTLDRMLSLYL